MAKKKEKTLEEKLQEALVPENQWPYILPENWCWTRLENINKYRGKSVTPQNNDDILFELYSVPSCENEYPEILTGSKIGSSKQLVEKKDVLLCKINPRINRVWQVLEYTNNTLLASSEWIVVRNRLLNSDYLVWYFKSPYFRECMLSNVSGVGGSLMRAKPKAVMEYPVPLAPLSEQKRIVNRIESLFAKLDEAKEKIQQVLDGAEMRKAAILHKAFTGELTKTWRKENTAIFENSSLGIDEELISDNLKELPDKWCWCKIGDFLELKAGKNIKADNISIEKNNNNKYACYGGNGIRGYVDSFNVEGTHIIIGRQGALCGNINIAENKFYATEHAVVVYPRYDTDISWLSENLRFLNLNQYSRSAAQPGLAVKNINNVLMPVAPYAEQVEMGRLISQMLNVWKQKEIICNKVLNKIDTMKKSILAKAFRGELGTNNPTEYSALNLLKEVLQDKS